MGASLFTGKLVQLSAPGPRDGPEGIARWSQDSQFDRLDDSNPAYPLLAKPIKEDWEKGLEGHDFLFAIRTLSDNRLIGFIELEIDQWIHGDAFAGIGIGEREYWGKGYGTDALRILLRYAFTELNLHRVTLDVFEYNPRAIRSYEKAGFVIEGRVRQFLNREGRRWDLIYMGILREEWVNE